MSYDALVWLLVGLGIGVAASLMLFLGYSMLEYGRLSRRLRMARAAAAAAGPAEKAAPVAPPKTSLLARPGARTEVAAKPVAEANAVTVAKPVAEAKAVTEVKPAVASKSPAGDKPPRPALVVVPASEARPAVVTKPAPAAPVVAVLSEPAPEAPKRPKSVEAMFAEAFANDRLPLSPEPDEAAGAAKPGAEKPPK